MTRVGTVLDKLIWNIGSSRRHCLGRSRNLWTGGLCGGGRPLATGLFGLWTDPTSWPNTRLPIFEWDANQLHCKLQPSLAGHYALHNWGTGTLWNQRRKQILPSLKQFWEVFPYSNQKRNQNKSMNCDEVWNNYVAILWLTRHYIIISLSSFSLISIVLLIFQCIYLSSVTHAYNF